MVLPHGLIYGSLVLGLVAALAVIGTDRKQLSSISNLLTGEDKLARFQRMYLPGFLLAMLADWLQGPFVYALYQGYGIDREHNGYLFVGGFGASAVFGTVLRPCTTDRSPSPPPSTRPSCACTPLAKMWRVAPDRGAKGALPRNT